jgi:hypothetical protein
VQSKRDSRARLKQRLLTALKLGAGSLVMATAVTTAAPAAVPPSDRSVVARADEARERLQSLPSADGDKKAGELLAWWGNWHNWGGPGWHNWPNWHNWHNWGNWHNW